MQKYQNAVEFGQKAISNYEEQIKVLKTREKEISNALEKVEKNKGEVFREFIGKISEEQKIVVILGAGDIEGLRGVIVSVKEIVGAEYIETDTIMAVHLSNLKEYEKCKDLTVEEIKVRDEMPAEIKRLEVEYHELCDEDTRYINVENFADFKVNKHLYYPDTILGRGRRWWIDYDKKMNSIIEELWDSKKHGNQSPDQNENLKRLFEYHKEIKTKISENERAREFKQTQVDLVSDKIRKAKSYKNSIESFNANFQNILALDIVYVLDAKSEAKLLALRKEKPEYDLNFAKLVALNKKLSYLYDMQSTIQVEIGHRSEHLENIQKAISNWQGFIDKDIVFEDQQRLTKFLVEVPVSMNHVAMIKSSQIGRMVRSTTLFKNYEHYNKALESMDCVLLWHLIDGFGSEHASPLLVEEVIPEVALYNSDYPSPDYSKVFPEETISFGKDLQGATAYDETALLMSEGVINSFFEEEVPGTQLSSFIEEVTFELEREEWNLDDLEKND